MPTDKKLKNLVLNVLTEEQYDSATKNEDELYITPDNSDELEKVIPTDVGVKDNKLGLVHDTVWLTNQNAINLGNGLTYDKNTNTLSCEQVVSIVNIDAKEDATNGTITTEQLSTLQANDANYVMFNHEKYYLGDKGHKEGFLTYSHVGFENGNTFIKSITITISTKAWVLNTTQVRNISVTENDGGTIDMEIA